MCVKRVCNLERKHLLGVVGLALTVIVSVGTLEAQHDPVPRTDPPGAGGPLPSLNLEAKCSLAHGHGSIN